MSTSTLHPTANVPAQHLETPGMHFFGYIRSCEWPKILIPMFQVLTI